jgi:hypothetical protein
LQDSRCTVCRLASGLRCRQQLQLLLKLQWRYTVGIGMFLPPPKVRCVILTIVVPAERTPLLDKINDSFFQPRGLYCVVMTWNPESSETHPSINLSTQVLTSVTQNNPDSSGLGMLNHNLQRPSGKTYGEVDFPITARLIFSSLDHLAMQHSEDAENKREMLKRARKSVDKYLDCRVQAKYVCSSPTHILAVLPFWRVCSPC